jgi:outer membrane lipoprotein-sorting protein
MMKRTPIVLALLLLVSVSARAADVDTVLVGLKTYWETINTFTTSFVQTKHLSLFSGDVTSRGTFAYKKPGNMVFRYDPPENTVIEFKPGLIIYYHPSLKKATRIHAADIPQWMSFGMGPIADIGALKDAAVITAADANGLTVLTFAPKDAKETVVEIAVSMKKDYTPVKVRISEKNGDFTVLDFSGQRVNPPVSDSVFEVNLPRDVTVEDVGK